MNLRQLNLSEIDEKFRDYIFDIENCHHSDVKYKLTQLINFLNTNDISNRILERIESNYFELKKELELQNLKQNRIYPEDIVQKLYTPDLQGAFAYFTILSKFDEKVKHTPHYIELPKYWYESGENYLEDHKNFNSKFLKPFSELFQFYIKESEVVDEFDYFSKESQEKMFGKLDELSKMLEKLGYGQEIIFKEIEELKELTEKLNKKNFGEIIKGKFLDLVIGGVINKEAAVKAIEFITGIEITLLN
jgi:hypothetical protein